MQRKLKQQELRRKLLKIQQTIRNLTELEIDIPQELFAMRADLLSFMSDEDARKLLSRGVAIVNYRFQPKDGEFDILDRMDELQILGDGTASFWKLGDLVSLSYAGMRKIAVINGIKVSDIEFQEKNHTLTATVGIHNPKTGWTGYGASQCDNTLENQAQNVAVKKAFRNAVRLSLPPWYLRECLKQLLNNRGLS